MARFAESIVRSLLPKQSVDLRRPASERYALAMISHAPSPGGVQYPAIDDLIISIVRRSQPNRIVREIGQHRGSFRDAKGCICVSPPRTPSYWQFDGTPEVLHIAVPILELGEDFPFVGELSERVSTYAIKPYYDPVVEALADRIWEIGSSGSPVSETLCEQATLTLASLVLQKMSDKPLETRPTLLAPWRLNRAIELLSSNFEEPISIDKLAKMVGLSPSHFSRAFTASTGFSPHEWLSRRRIERAKQLLQTTGNSTTDIAFELGYSSPNHFASRFRQLTGMSPREWRRTHPAPT